MTADAGIAAWALFSRLGESTILLPAMLGGLLWLMHARRAPATAAWWAGSVFVAASVTTATKIGFHGYELGYAPLDYAGISGHAMFAAAIWPVFAAIAVSSEQPRARAWAVVGGFALAAAIAASRVTVHAHSPIEVVLGFALGTTASALVLLRAPPPGLPQPWRLLAPLLIWFVVLPLGAPPSPTHGWVLRLSMLVADRPRPYTRWQMHRDWARRHAPARPPAAAFTPPPHRR